MKTIQLNREEIYCILPHRGPITMLEQALISTESEVVTRIFAPTDSQMMRGHFPDQPMLPGTYLTEAMAQSCGILLLSKEGNDGKLPLLLGINNMRFLSQIIPGNEIEIRATLTTLADNGMADFKVSAYVSGAKVASGTLLMICK